MYKGLPLIDAFKDLELEVSKSDVSHAKRNNPSKCAAALALSRALGVEAEVHIGRTYIKQGRKWIRFMTPASVQREITSFDRSDIFEPGEYILKAPSKSAQLGNHRSGPSGTKKYNKSHKTINIRKSAR